ncbi:MAG: DnaB-like helicase C-terminal domain-containing protein [Eubacteriales bacterium]|nr:DnaB-like helicase C-terminal domain-containing protein [Eubacteriales bacterium]
MDIMGTNGFYSHDYERTLVGAFLQDSNTYRYLQSLESGDMHCEEHMEIVNAMKDLLAAKVPLDALTVSDALNKGGTLDSVGGVSYLLQAIRYVPTTANIRTYYNKVKELSLRRKLYTLLSNKATVLNDPSVDSDTVVDEVLTKLRALTDDRGEVVRAAQIASATFDDLEKRVKGETTAIMTDLPDLNHVTGGMQKGELTVIGARPGVGKSAFAVGMALFASRKSYRGLVVSREMTDVQYGQRVLSNMADVDGMKIRRGNLETEEWERIGDAINEFAGLPLSFTFRTRTVEELRMVAQHEKDSVGLDVLYVDYLQLMGTKQRTDTEALRLGKISGALKDIALDLNIAVVAMAQVKRTEGRAAVMPILSDLKGSGDIEQDADNVIFLHHPEAADDPSIMPKDRDSFAAYDSNGMQYIAVNVAKQRQGNTGIFGVIFDPAHMRYMCIAR